MRADKQIKVEAAQAGQVGVRKLQLEVLLDIRQLLNQQLTGQGMTESGLAIIAEHLKTLIERWRKPGRPRKKSGPKPAGQ